VRDIAVCFHRGNYSQGCWKPVDSPRRFRLSWGSSAVRPVRPGVLTIRYDHARCWHGHHCSAEYFQACEQPRVEVPCGIRPKTTRRMLCFDASRQTRTFLGPL
ncbi:hypothetical protein T265_00057, partial [Opisthorchis viverrini]